MPEQTFYCPHCKSHLTKSAQAYVMGESMTTEGAVFVHLGSLPETIQCPQCGGAIDNKKMMLGEYDHRAGQAGGSRVLPFILLAAVVAFGVYMIWLR